MNNEQIYKYLKTCKLSLRLTETKRSQCSFELNAWMFEIDWIGQALLDGFGEEKWCQSFPASVLLRFIAVPSNEGIL